MRGSGSPGGRTWGREATILGVCAGTLLVVLTLGGLTVAGLREGHAQQLDRMAGKAQRLAYRLDRHLDTRLASIDATLQRIGEACLRESAGHPPRGGLEGVIRRQMALNPMVASIRLEDASGRRIQACGAAGLELDGGCGCHPGRDPSALQGASRSDAGMHACAGRAELRISRRLTDSRGGFAGRIIATAPLGMITGDFQEEVLGRRGTVALLDGRFRPLVQYTGPGRLGAAGGSPPPGTLPEPSRWGQREGTFRVAHPAEGGPRVVAFRRLERQPLVICVGLAEGASMAAWRAGAFRTGILAILAECLIIASTAGLLRAWWLRCRDAEHLRAREALLAEANRKLAELDRQKNRFLGIVAHDLRNPLSGILLAAQWLEAEVPLEEVRGPALRIRKAGEAMAMLVERFLGLARLQSGWVQTALEPLDLGILMGEVLEGFRAQAEDKGIAFRAHLAQGARVLGDLGFLRQVLENLVSNAVKFSPLGSEITLRVERDSGGVVGSVEDQGPGFTEADRLLLFEPFAKLSARPTGGEPSTGLGLSIAKSMVEACGGRIWVDPGPGGGAAFRFRLPEA